MFINYVNRIKNIFLIKQKYAFIIIVFRTSAKSIKHVTIELETLFEVASEY